MRVLAVWRHGRFLLFICTLSDPGTIFTILVSASGFDSSYVYCTVEFSDQFRIGVLATYCVFPFSPIRLFTQWVQYQCVTRDDAMTVDSVVRLRDLAI